LALSSLKRFSQGQCAVSRGGITSTVTFAFAAVVVTASDHVTGTNIIRRPAALDALEEEDVSGNVAVDEGFDLII